MDYTITVPASANGTLTASPSSGVLGTNQSVTVTLTLSRPSTFDQAITINPGGLSVTVIYNPPQSDNPTTPPPVVGEGRLGGLATSLYRNAA
jgi:hypothetical protein